MRCAPDVSGDGVAVEVRWKRKVPGVVVDSTDATVTFAIEIALVWIDVVSRPLTSPNGTSTTQSCALDVPRSWSATSRGANSGIRWPELPTNVALPPMNVSVRFAAGSCSLPVVK